MLSSQRRGVARWWTGFRRAIRPAFLGAARPAGLEGERSAGATCAADEIGQQASRFVRFRAPGPVGVPGSVRRKRAALEHPAGKKSQGRLLHHLIEENSKLPAEIRNVFQLGHFKVAQRSARTFAKIVHRRSVKVSGHSESPEDRAVAAPAPRAGRVTQPNYCASGICRVGNTRLVNQSHACSYSRAAGRT